MTADLKEYLFLGDEIEIAYYQGSSNYTVFSFSERRYPAAPGFFGEGFFSKNDISVVYIKNNVANWYNSQELEQAVSILSTLRSQLSNECFAYGYSMGAFGAVLFSKYITFSGLLLLGPVLNIKPNFENRWVSDIERFSRKEKDIFWDIRGLVDSRVTFFLDENSKDNNHIEGLDNNGVFHVPYASHLVPEMLRDMGILSKVVLKYFEGQLTQSYFKKLLKKNASNSIKYCLKKYAVEEKNKDFYLEKASKIAHSKPRASSYYELSNYYSRNKQLSNALDLIKKAYVMDNNKLNKELSSAIFNFVNNGGSDSSVDNYLKKFYYKGRRSRQTQLNFSRYLRVIGAYEEALKSHSDYLLNDLFSSHWYYERGLILERLGLYEYASLEYQKCVKLNSSYPGVQMRLKN